LHIEVPEKGAVHVRGLVRTDEERARLKEVLGRMKEISELEFDVTVAPLSAE